LEDCDVLDLEGDDTRTWRYGKHCSWKGVKKLLVL
jgi:hypothetical protein